MKIMKQIIKRAHFVIYILLTCVLCGGCGLKGDIKAVEYKNNTIDSLQLEFEKANSLVDYYNIMQDSSGGVLENSDMWWAYRDSAYRAIDKMIKINNERMRVRNAR